MEHWRRSHTGFHLIRDRGRNRARSGRGRAGGIDRRSERSVRELLGCDLQVEMAHSLGVHGDCAADLDDGDQKDGRRYFSPESMTLIDADVIEDEEVSATLLMAS